MRLICRRRFFQYSLSLSAAAVSATSVGKALAMAAGESGTKMALGLVTYQWGRDWDLPTLLANCEKAGLLAVELRTTHAHGVEPSLNAAQRREVRKRFADSPVDFVGPGSNECFDNPDPQVLARSIEAAKEFVLLSHDCGGSGVKVKPNSFHPNVPREKTIEQIGRSLNDVAKFAAGFGQEIRLEVHGTCAELPIMKQIMDVADHPNAVLCWNSNAQDLRGEGLEHNFNLVKARFGHTAHVRELNTPDYPFQKLVGLFAAMDYGGWILLECASNPADRVAAMIQQRELFESMLANALESAR